MISSRFINTTTAMMTMMIVGNVLSTLPCTANAFVSPSAMTTTNTKTTIINNNNNNNNDSKRSGSSFLSASSMNKKNNESPTTKQELFKAGLLANCEMEAAALASTKIRSVQDLGWTKPAKRAGRTRPRHWAWGGGGEKAVQDKPNYDESSPNCVEKWLSLQDFYKLIKDDTAVADTIFVALAGGGAYIERQVAEDVIAKWRPTTNTAAAVSTTTTAKSSKGLFSMGRKSSNTAAVVAAFDTNAFLKTVQEGRVKFATGWIAFLSITGFALIGIIFPTNPVQLALVDLLENVMGNDAQLAALAAAKSQGVL